MSQAKVDARKQAKLHMKENMRKEKIKRTVTTTITVILFVAIVGWALYSVGTNIYNSYQETHHPKQEIDLTALTDYMSEVNQ